MGHFPLNLNKWPGGRIPFRISSLITGNSLVSLQQAIEDWNAAAVGIQLVPKASTDFNWVHFTVKIGGGSPCNSTHVGMAGGKQSVKCWVISIVQGVSVATWTHEIGHVIGLKHEHQRWDRDDFVFFKPQIAVFDGQKLGNYKKLPPFVAGSVGPYDCKSRMHYFPRAFGGIQYFGPKKLGLCVGGIGGAVLTATDLDTVKKLYT